MCESRRRNCTAAARNYRSIPASQVSFVATEERCFCRTESQSFCLAITCLRSSYEISLQVLTTVDGRPGWAFDTAQLLEEMREINQQAAGDYLEHVVVVRRSIVSTRKMP